MRRRNAVHRNHVTRSKGWIRPRPIRVAFLVQDGEHAQIALDGIFADCYYHWGGRFSLIVPCREGRIVLLVGLSDRSLRAPHILRPSDGADASHLPGA